MSRSIRIAVGATTAAALVMGGIVALDRWGDESSSSGSSTGSAATSLMVPVADDLGEGAVPDKRSQEYLDKAKLLEPYIRRSADGTFRITANDKVKSEVGADLYTRFEKSTEAVNADILAGRLVSGTDGKISLAKTTVATDGTSSATPTEVPSTADTEAESPSALPSGSPAVTPTGDPTTAAAESSAESSASTGDTPTPTESAPASESASASPSASVSPSASASDSASASASASASDSASSTSSSASSSASNSGSNSGTGSSTGSESGSASASASASQAEEAGNKVKAHWWGMDIHLDSSSTKQLVAAMGGVSTITTALIAAGLFTTAVSVPLAIVAAIVTVAAAIVTACSNTHGVNLYITWIGVAWCGTPKT